jgi:hypothetical protein
MGGWPSLPIGRNGSKLALTNTGCGDDIVMFGTRASIDVGGEELASNEDIMSLPLFVSWLVLTLYKPNFRRVRKISARDLLDSVGADVGAGACGASTGAACSLF